jgi:hypothetical protein
VSRDPRPRRRSPLCGAESTAHSTADSSGLDPKMFEVRYGLAELQAVESHDLSSVGCHNNLMAPYVVRCECELRAPSKHPIVRIAPVSLGAPKQAREGPRLVGICISECEVFGARHYHVGNGNAVFSGRAITWPVLEPPSGIGAYNDCLPEDQDLASKVDSIGRTATVHKPLTGDLRAPHCELVIDLHAEVTSSARGRCGP